MLAALVLAGAATRAAADEQPLSAPTASMNEVVLDIPGDPSRPALLQVTVLKPDGAGPFPLMVMNHGAAAATPPALQARYRYTFAAYYFLSRGYVVALPMMRGFAGSQGKQVVAHCNQQALGTANAKDIRAVIDFMASQPYVDGEHVVAGGQSFGGWNALALGALRPPGLRALINFAGGVVSSTCASTAATLASGAARYAADTSIPSIWFYGENDATFAPPVWRGMFESYVAAGGPARLVAYGSFMKDAHNALGSRQAMKIWAPEVDAFLRQLGLPSSIAHPEYLPMAFPPASNFAAIGDVDAVPYLDDEGRQAYREFLSEPSPKVFVISPAGLAASFNSGFDPLGRAMRACADRAQRCQVYAADNDVTWVAVPLDVKLD